MYFIAQGKNIEICDLTLTDNLAMYHNTISFSTPAKLYTEEGRIEFSKSSLKTDVCVVSQQKMDNGLYKTDCVTKPVRKAFGSVTQGFNGRTTLNGLFTRLGFEYFSDYKSNNTYFSIPRCKITTLFDNITQYASFANGGGAHFYMKMDGCIYGYDYKLIKEKAMPKVIEGQITAENIDMEWLDFITSEQELLIYDENNNFKKENFILEQGFGKSVVSINDTTGLAKEAFKQELTNEFYNRWYMSHTVSITTMKEVDLGDLVNLNNTGDTYIVKGINMTYNEAGMLPTVSVELISNPVFE